MKEIEIKNAFEKLYYDKLDNGLDIYLLPNPKAKSFYLTLNVNFGSIDTDFKVNNKTYHVPNGVAHYLEHLMFNEPNGETAHAMFAKLGSNCNAATSFEYTFYEVSAINKFKENLEYLLDYVYRPYFTEENVKQEKGIIVEEVKMGESSPFRELFFKSRANVYHNNHHRYTISGEVEDVKSITKKDIEVCYNTFYHPENMFIVITGNFNPYEAKAIIAENMSKKSFLPFKKITHLKIDEPSSVLKDYEVKEMNVLVPKVSFNIKMNTNNFKSFNKLKLSIYLNIYLSLKFSQTSNLNELLLNNNLITDNLSYSVNIDQYNVLITISFESLYPNEVIKLIKEKFNNNNISLNDLKRKARVEVSNEILHFDDIYAVNENIQNQIFYYQHFYEDIIPIYQSLSLKEFNSIISKINLSNSSVFVIEPTKKSS